MNEEKLAEESCLNRTGLCACGCGEVTAVAAVTDRRKRYQKGCSRLYVNGHNGRKSGEPFEIDERNCWVWLRSRNAGGYGRVRDGNKMRLAHIVWYERFVGAVPAGRVLHHICERGHEGCMSPWHLVPVTPAENARLGRGTKLVTEEVTKIRELVMEGERTKISIAREFGVSDVQIHHIAAGRCWRDQQAA